MRDGKGGIDVIPTFVGMIREMYLPSQSVI